MFLSQDSNFASLAVNAVSSVLAAWLSKSVKDAMGDYRRCHHSDDLEMRSVQRNRRSRAQNYKLVLNYRQFIIKLRVRSIYISWARPSLVSVLMENDIVWSSLVGARANGKRYRVVVPRWCPCEWKTISCGRPSLMSMRIKNEIWKVWKGRQ